MRRRRKAGTPSQELRHLALAGRWEELRALLEARLARDPHDAEARGELERLRQGLPLRATESPLARKRREEQEMQEELAAELDLYHSQPGMPEEWGEELLQRRCKRVALMRRRLSKALSPETEQQAAAYHDALAQRLSTLRGKRRRRLLLGLGLPLLLALTAGLGYSMQQRAARAEERLLLALQSREPAQVEQALLQADSWLNRLNNSELGALIQRAQLWRADSLRQSRELQTLLSQLEAGQGSICSLPLIRRAELERQLQALPPSMNALRARWQQLCAKEAQALAAQRIELLQRFSAALPELPILSGNAAEDDKLLAQQQQQLLQLNREWTAAYELFQLAPAYGIELQQRLDVLEQYRADITTLRRATALLPSARSYSQYRAILEASTPLVYEPACRLADIRKRLPQEDDLQERMLGHGRQLPPGMLEAARHAHLEGGPSFTAAFPANARQLQLMEDIFSYTGLQKVLYELSAATLPSIIVEERPEVSETSVCFSPSPLTPGYTLDTPRRITWHNPQAVYIRRIDATPLLRETGITRESFFSQANLPALLDRLLRIGQEDCPALARAFVFKRLAEVITAHEWSTMFGIAYAPSLRADLRSFAQLCRELPLTLEAGCWLRDCAERSRAEEACARWFREHRHRRYAQEIARNFGALVEIHPRYVGYIDAEGKPQLYRSLPEGTLLWYVAADGLGATPLGEAPENPVIYSAVFVVAKN